MKTKFLQFLAFATLFVGAIFNLQAQSSSLDTWLELRDEVNDITSNCHGKYAKAKAIYNWLVDNIEYDDSLYSAISTGSSPVEDIMSNTIMVEFVRSKYYNKWYTENDGKYLMKFVENKWLSLSSAIKSEYKRALNDPVFLNENMEFNRDNQTAGLKVFEQHKGICSSISHLYQIMCQMAGIPCSIVSGIANTGSSMGFHAWNALMIDGKMILVDATWGITGDKESYFNVNPYWLIRTHLPCEKKYQNIANAVTTSAFMKSARKGMEKSIKEIVKKEVQNGFQEKQLSIPNSVMEKITERLIPKSLISKLVDMEVWYYMYIFKNNKQYFPPSVE